MRPAVGRALSEAQAGLDRECGAHTRRWISPRMSPARAAAVNDTAVGNLRGRGRTLRQPARCTCRRISCSTAARAAPTCPGDAPRPLSVYGASKLGGERRALGGGCAGIVLRTAWVYAAAGRNFVLTMLRLMREREQVRVVCDQIGTPTWASGLARAVWGLIDADAASGIYHWTDLGVASWYDFAVAIHEEALACGLARAPDRRSCRSRPRNIPRARAGPRSASWTLPQRRALLPTTPAVHWRGNLRTMLDELRAA